MKFLVIKWGPGMEEEESFEVEADSIEEAKEEVLSVYGITIDPIKEQKEHGKSSKVSRNG